MIFREDKPMFPLRSSLSHCVQKKTVDLGYTSALPLGWLR
jgi:hypothetical protein